jgi:hypothetical protein
MSRPLSPAVQAVLDAAIDAWGDPPTRLKCAAAPRAAVEQLLPLELGLPKQAPTQGHIRQDQRGKTRRELLAIAAELEAGE